LGSEMNTRRGICARRGCKTPLFRVARTKP
jgi:hypothetical protein